LGLIHYLKLQIYHPNHWLGAILGPCKMPNHTGPPNLKGLILKIYSKITYYCSRVVVEVLLNISMVICSKPINYMFLSFFISFQNNSLVFTFQMFSFTRDGNGYWTRPGSADPYPFSRIWDLKNWTRRIRVGSGSIRNSRVRIRISEKCPDPDPWIRRTHF
jgi:hypothetical protein